MQYRAKKELKSNSRLELKDTEGFREFQELCCKKVTLPFLKCNAKDIAKLVKVYKEDPSLIYNFAEKYLEGKLQPQKFASTPYSAVGMFLETQGFTGTPYNRKTFDKKLEVVRDVNSAGKTQGIIWKNSQIVHELNASEFTAMIDEIAEIQKNGDYSALIDAGAIFNGIDNENVARALLKTLPKNLHGVVYYQENSPIVLERNGTKTPLELYGSTEWLYIYYDQWHTTGTDLKIKNKSLLTVGKNKMRDIEQAYMRDRQAEQGKRVEFITQKESAKLIRKELDLSPDTKISTAHILRYTEIVQEREIVDLMLMGTIGRLKQVLQQRLRVLQQQKRLIPSELKEKAKMISSLIGEIVQDAPWEQFGQLEEPIPKKEFFEQYIEQVIEKIAPLSHELYDDTFNEEVLKQQLWKCIDLELLPDMLSGSSSSSKLLADQQSQTQKQQQRMAMVQKEQMSDEDANKGSGAIHWNWDLDMQTCDRSFYRHANPSEISDEMLPRVSRATNLNAVMIPTSKGQVPIFRLSDLMEQDANLKPFADLFDLQASYNFQAGKATIIRNKKIAAVQNPTFASGQLDVQNLLICKDRQTGEVQVMLISLADKGFFFEKLAKEREANTDRELDVSIYNLILGITQSNNEDILSGNENILDYELRQLIVQAKFFNGESMYSKEEEPLLKDWIAKKGSKRMQELFFEHILTQDTKKDKSKEFSNSSLERCF